MARRKGHLEEIFSKALYADDHSLYLVSYRDVESIVQVGMEKNFTESSQRQHSKLNFETLI